jgi:hypothetical protein
MPPLDPRTDFRDDGGTPGWRARRTIDVQPRRGFWWTLWHLPVLQFVSILIVLGLTVPIVIIIGGLALFGLWDHLVGN